MKRAFTLLELLLVCLVISFLAAILVPNFIRSQLSDHAVLKSEGARASAQIFTLLAASRGYHVDADNHGLTTAEGTTVRWRADRLEVQAKGAAPRSLVRASVKDFTAVRRGPKGVLLLNLELESRHGRFSVAEVYDYPRIGLP